jgi:hypothetical protein
VSMRERFYCAEFVEEKRRRRRAILKQAYLPSPKSLRRIV